MRTGYVGVAGERSFWGYNAYARRYMFIATGAYADECASRIPEALDTYASFARVDVQSTFKVSDADAFIRDLKRARRYQATRISRDGDRGATFYVGSRSSNLFCRVYNKSIEANLLPDGDGELVRVEFVLRDDYADKVWRRFRGGELDFVFGSLVERMFERDSATCIIERVQIALSGRDLELLRRDHDDWRERRLAWLENTVIPALNKLMTESPEFAKRVRNALDNLPVLADNGK
jgi:hypothetical protein